MRKLNIRHTKSHARFSYAERSEAEGAAEALTGTYLGVGRLACLSTSDAYQAAKLTKAVARNHCVYVCAARIKCRWSRLADSIHRDVLALCTAAQTELLGPRGSATYY